MQPVTIFTIGATIGATVSYFVTKHVLTKKFNEELGSQMQHMREEMIEVKKELKERSNAVEECKAIMRKYGLEVVDGQEVIHSLSEDPRDPKEILAEQDEAQRKRYEETEDLVETTAEERDHYYNYSGLYEYKPIYLEKPLTIMSADDPDRLPLMDADGDYNYQDPFDNSNTAVVARGYTQPNIKPYVINEEQYTTECPDYDKIEATFWQGDSTLVIDDEDRDDIVDDIQSAIGRVALNHLHRSAQATAVYVRNEVTETDWNIVVVSAAKSTYMGEDIGLGV